MPPEGVAENLHVPLEVPVRGGRLPHPSHPLRFWDVGRGERVLACAACGCLAFLTLPALVRRDKLPGLRHGACEGSLEITPPAVDNFLERLA